MSGQGFHYQKGVKFALDISGFNWAGRSNKFKVLVQLNESKRDKEKLDRSQFVQIQIRAVCECVEDMVTHSTTSSVVPFIAVIALDTALVAFHRALTNTKRKLPLWTRIVELVVATKHQKAGENLNLACLIQYGRYRLHFQMRRECCF